MKEKRPPIPDLPPRLTALAFPSYAFVPGMHPHPRREAAGHSYGRAEPSLSSEDPAQICQLRDWGVDLFNHGYYWEAHEAWEALWQAWERRSLRSRLMQALIKLAAAGVKARQGSVTGVQRHARRAAELFDSVAAELQSDASEAIWFDPIELRNQALGIVRDAPQLIDTRPAPLHRILPLVLMPR